MDQWKGKVALVTGASSGIGAAIARSLVENGMNVVGCSRKIDAIEVHSALVQVFLLIHSLYTQAMSQELSSAPGKLVAMKCDVRNEEEIKAVFQFARTQFGGVDVCVNNAGLGLPGSLLTGSTEDWRQVMEVSA